MKMKRFIATAVMMIALTGAGSSQGVNWRSLQDEQLNLVQLNFGYDFGATIGARYGRLMNIGRPVVLGLEYSMPMGRDLVDDFKVRIGGEVEVVQLDGFSATVKIFSNLRRYENALVRIISFGSDFAAVAGYYRSTWHAAGEFGFDKAIATHLKHSDTMKADFPAIRDGWYVPTGGNFYYGIQGGKTIGDNLDLTLRLGATAAQEKDENPEIPFYAQLGVGMRF
jgi:hypothetical protein